MAHQSLFQRVFAWACVPVLLALLGFSQSAGANSGELGEKIFKGQVSITAKLAGHTQELPAQASKCANCHAGERPLAQLFGGRLSQSLHRRGGPPSRFDATSLCRLLREGIDPAFVIINTTMPRYAVSAAQCEALWTYFERR